MTKKFITERVLLCRLVLLVRRLSDQRFVVHLLPLNLFPLPSNEPID